MLGKMNVAVLVGVALAMVGTTVNPVGAVCTGGIEGIESTSLDACCVEACGQCGGAGCNPGANSTLTAADCCATEIVDAGIMCSDTGAAPCLLSTAAASNDSVCDNGQTGIQDSDTDVCCPLECGSQCGGDGCGTVPGVDGSQCCAAQIMESGAVCSDTVEPPCVVVAAAAADNSTCSNGLEGIEDLVEGICCDAACGQCGGVGCGNIAGLTGADCCSAVIETDGVLCSVSGEAPCIVDPPEFMASTCPNGLAGYQDDTVCCAEACGQCGGEGCGTISGTAGPDDCCSGTILTSGVQCGNGVEAPCIMVDGTYTNAPAVSPLELTVAPSSGSRGFSMAPTAVGVGTSGPTAGSRGGFGTGIPTTAPTSVDEIGQSSAPTTGSRGLGSSAPTPSVSSLAPSTTIAPTAVSAAPTKSTGFVVTLAALVGGAFAIFAVAHN